jgi:hypothetical protein
VKLLELVVEVPAALVAVTVQVPVPVPVVPTVRLPLVPDVEPEAAPEQLTDAEVAPLVDQLKVFVLPDVVFALAIELDAVGAATTANQFEPVALVPAAL